MKIIKNSRGESIAEVLIALLISSLGILMLAGMITSSSKMIQNSQDTMKKYYIENNKLDQRNSDTSTFRIVILNGVNSFTYKNVNYIENTAYQVRSKDGKSTIIAYYK